MRRYIITAFLLSNYAVSAIAADSYTINEREITVPTPNGFVRVTDNMTAVKRLIQQMADPTNDTLAYYIEQSDVPTALAGKIPSLERTFILKVNKQLRNITVGKNDFSQLKEMTKSQNQKMFEQVKSEIPEHMKKMSQVVSQEFDVDFAMDISQMVPLEPHYEAENALAYSMYINYGVTTGEEKAETIVAATVTILNASGVVLFLYGYAPQNELKWTREGSMNWAESVLDSNTQPPARSPKSRGFDWNKVVEKSVVSAIIGGLIAMLIVGILSVVKRKNG